MRTFLLVGILVSFVACADEIKETSAGAEALLEQLQKQGPYGVGYRSYSVSYETPLSKEVRTVQALVWYPSEETDGERPLYLVKASEIAVKNGRPAALRDRPVILYSHGHQAYPAVMSYLMEHWASHGYVVISPGHTGNTIINGPDRETDIYYLRAYDLRAAFEFVRDIESDPLQDMLSDRLMVAGHSYGGYTAFAIAGAGFAVETLKAQCDADPSSNDFCSTLTPEKEALFRGGLHDERVLAMMSFDPGNFDMFGTEGLSKIDVPVLHAVAEFGSHADPDASKDKFWTALHHDLDLRLLLKGGDHNDFVDSCGAGVEIRCSDLNPEEIWRAMRIYTLAFIRRSFGTADEAASVLSGEEKVWDQLGLWSGHTP
jgi:predicted dienelactone hydrolase